MSKINRNLLRTLVLLILVSLLIFFITVGCANHESTPPYPNSEFLKGIELNWKTHQRLAVGSDNWPITWGDDGHQYTSWGDGGGFGGNNKKGRVSLGVAKVIGDQAKYKGKNVYGGFGKEKSSIDGKSYGIISIKGILYMWISPGSDNNNYKYSKLFFSENHGETWNQSAVEFNKNDGILHPTFLQCGKDFNTSPSEYVYIYAIKIKNHKKLMVQKPGEIVLIRVNLENLRNQNEYSYFSGINSSGNPIWAGSLENSKPVFFDKNGIGWNCSSIYIKDLDRVILVTEHDKSFKGNIGIFEAKNPWGPWHTIHYASRFGSPDIEPSTFFWNFSSKWLSDNGKSFVLIFSGIKENDSWNSVEGNFIF